MTERLERIGSVVLLLAAAVALVLFARHWPPSGEPSEVVLKGLLSVAVVALLLAARRLPLRRSRARVYAVLVLCAAASSFAHYNFGRFHFPQLPHYWEQFHYQIGARYFAELGYDGLYVASLAAEQRLAPERAPQRKLRDLRTNRVRLTERLEDHGAEVRSRFSTERWRRFVADHRHFVRAMQPADLEAVRRDHGYNPTPFWTVVAQQVQGDDLLLPRVLRRLAALDSLLLAVGFAAIFRTFGLRTGCLCLLVFGLGYAGRFKWIGGAFLRFDWLAALMLAVCALARERGATAGLLLGYATAVRLFPAAFLLGPAIAAVAAWRRGERPRWPGRMAAGFVAALLLALALGGLAGRGMGAWSEFASRMELYQLSIARNSVGLEWLPLYGGETLSRAADAVSGDDAFWRLQREDVIARQQHRWLAMRALQGVFLLVLSVALWRAPPAAALVLSMGALFAVTPSAGYYWSLLLLAPVAVRWPGVLALLLVNTAMYGVHLLVEDNLVRYGLLSWGLAVVFAVWLVPEALRVLGGVPARWHPRSAGVQTPSE